MESLIDELRRLLGAGMPSMFGTAHFGDPVVNPSWNIPCMSVVPRNTKVEPVTFHRDTHTHAVTVMLVLSAKDNFGGHDEENATDRKLVQYVEGVRNDDGTVKTDGVFTLLRRDITLGGKVFRPTACSVQYVPALRGSEALRVARVELAYEDRQAR